MDKIISQLVSTLEQEDEETYAQVTKRLAYARELVHTIIATQLQEPLNKKLDGIPSESYAEKKLLAGWLNSELRTFGVAAVCENTGLPSRITAGPGHNPRNGRFRIVPYGGKRTTFSSANLFNVSLTPYFIRNEGQAKSWEELTTNSNDQGKKSR